jgi:dethiobiotin synthetase
MGKMQRAPIFITGTGTGVGKTLLTALLAVWIRQNGVRVAALKPVCSGGRADAELLAAALAGNLTLDEINPWHFRAPIAPVLAARLEGARVTRARIMAHVRRTTKRFAVVLIEGAGGLLSPLGEKVDSRDLITALGATPVIVAPNRLGVINDLRLTLAALPSAARKQALVVLMDPETPDAATHGNAGLLGEYFDQERVVHFPWLRQTDDLAKALQVRRVREAVARLQLHLFPAAGATSK